MLSNLTILESLKGRSACDSVAPAPALTAALRVTPSLLVRTVGLLPTTAAGIVLVVAVLGPGAILVEARHPGLSHPWHPAGGVASLSVQDLSMFSASSCSLAAVSLASRSLLSSVAAAAIFFS